VKSFVTATGILVLVICRTVAADVLTTNDAVYSKDQAKIGEELYANHCLLCHDKKYFRPVFKAWEGKTLGTLNTVMNTSMPQSNPGSLPLKDYVDILAYMLSLNRYPAGDGPLTNDNNRLDSITIAPR
jgi:quinoprotein glucose dehydrogenase